jgi:heat shock protein HslJ
MWTGFCGIFRRMKILLTMVALIRELLWQSIVLISGMFLLKGEKMNKIILTGVTLLIASSMILSACASASPSASLAGTSWKLVSYGPVQNQVAAAPGNQTNLGFGTDGTVNGNMGCNSFSGSYIMKDGSIAFSKMLSTMMACLGPQMDQEQTALKVMNGTARFQLKANTLTLYDASGADSITLSK